MSSSWQKSQSFYRFSISISGDSYFSEMIMLINLEYILAQTRMGFSRVTVPSKGHMRAQYVFVMAKLK